MERYANYDTFANVYNRYCWPHSAAVFAVRRRSHHDPGRGSRTAPRSSRSPPPKVAIPIASPMLFATVSSNSSKGWISRLTNVTYVAPTPKPTAPASPIHQWPLAGDHRPRGKESESDRRHNDLQDVGGGRVRIHDGLLSHASRTHHGRALCDLHLAPRITRLTIRGDIGSRGVCSQPPRTTIPSIPDGCPGSSGIRHSAPPARRSVPRVGRAEACVSALQRWPAPSLGAKLGAKRPGLPDLPTPPRKSRCFQNTGSIARPIVPLLPLEGRFAASVWSEKAAKRLDLYEE